MQTELLALKNLHETQQNSVFESQKTAENLEKSRQKLEKELELHKTEKAVILEKVRKMEAENSAIQKEAQNRMKFSEEKSAEIAVLEKENESLRGENGALRSAVRKA